MGKEVSKKMPTLSLWPRFVKVMRVFISFDWGVGNKPKSFLVFTALPSSLLKFRTVFVE